MNGKRSRGVENSKLKKISKNQVEKCWTIKSKLTQSALIRAPVLIRLVSRAALSLTSAALLSRISLRVVRGFPAFAITHYRTVSNARNNPYLNGVSYDTS